MDYRYIVVEGSIGSGKSEVSQRLAGYFNALCAELDIQTEATS